MAKVEKKGLFFDKYDEVKKKQRVQDTPSQAWVKEVAKITNRSEATVRMWLSGMNRPDPLVVRVLAEAWKVDENALFL